MVENLGRVNYGHIQRPYSKKGIREGL
ncbi:MAG: hypothetical protein ACLTYB_13360 [Clostridium paraputrificum]